MLDAVIKVAGGRSLARPNRHSTINVDAVASDVQCAICIVRRQSTSEGGISCAKTTLERKLTIKREVLHKTGDFVRLAKPAGRNRALGSRDDAIRQLCCHVGLNEPRCNLTNAKDFSIS